MDPDGTQPSKPLTAFDDPLAGLVTGASRDNLERAAEPDRLEIASPVEPDPAVVQDMVDAALRGELPEELRAQAGGETGETGEIAEVAGAEVPEQRQPAQTPLGLLPQAPKRAFPQRPARKNGPRKPKLSSGSTGMILAILLLLVFGVLIVQFLISLIESISGIFD